MNIISGQICLLTHLLTVFMFYGLMLEQSSESELCCLFRPAALTENAKTQLLLSFMAVIVKQLLHVPKSSGEREHVAFRVGRKDSW